MTDPSPRLERFREALRPIVFDANDKGVAKDEARLLKVRRGLPRVAAAVRGWGEKEIRALLERRAAKLEKGLADFLAQRYLEFSQQNLRASHSFAILFAHARMADALHRFAFETAWEEIAAIARLTLLVGEKENRFRRSLLPKKMELLHGLRAQRPPVPAEAELDEEAAYHEKIAADLEKEVAGLEAAAEGWEGQRAAIEGFSHDREAMLRSFALFARGGYGRGELSFASDLDTGYCVDARVLAAGELAVFQELIIRMETLLRRGGLEPAHQYFEIGEDLSRFAEPETLHTIPSVLESRTVLGNPELLAQLRESFFAVLPYEEFLKKKINDYEAQQIPPLTEMDLKEDRGGLRTIQIPLWILGVTHRARSFFSADLITLAQEQGLLSIGEAARFLFGLELLYDLRNFVGCAEGFYYDPEARTVAGGIAEFPANRINDALARLYIFRKRRFESLDAFDSFRLRLVSDIARISRRLLDNLLDQTIVRQQGGLRLAVHLGQKRITSIESPGGATGELAQHFQRGDAFLQLMAYIARSDYDLADGLKDTLAEAVEGVRLAETPAELTAQAAQFSAIMAAPYAHQALTTMWEINDPLSSGWKSLLGRFIPECDRLTYLLREATTLARPVHEHLLRALFFGQQSLDWLRAGFHDLHALLQPSHVLALKWSLFLHGTGKPLENGDDPARSAEMAVEVLARLGYDDPALERLVRLLIQHHRTVASLNRTATYHDQALVQVFEAAQRDTVNVVLLFLVNISILRADGERSEEDLADLYRFFDQTSTILAELPGVPDAPRSLELINFYLDRKKTELQAETRLHLLLRRALAVGWEASLYGPLATLAPQELERMGSAREKLEGQLRQLVLGTRGASEREREEIGIIQALGSALSEATAAQLTHDQNEVFSWFFSGFPNRYLLAARPSEIAEQMATFGEFRKTRVRAAVNAGAQGVPDVLLFFTRELANTHARVAYALSRKRINIISGKVNPVDLPGGSRGYCYFFQISPPPPETALFPRDLERMILHETPRNLKPQEAPAAPAAPAAHMGSGVRVEFLGNDRKGYQVAPVGGGFERRDADYRLIRVLLRDEPFLFYRATKIFEFFEVEIQQSLITTTGNQVGDYFYLLPEDYARLQSTNFVEQFLRMMQMGLE
ncbi:MAG: hypothetical protein V3S29_07865 [bacterium]